MERKTKTEKIMNAAETSGRQEKSMSAPGANATAKLVLLSEMA